MEHTIINHAHSKNYTVIPNDLLQAQDISPYALGILCYLLSLPTMWNISASKLAERYGEKEVRIIRALNDLIGLGYCKRVPLRSEGKLRGQQYFITDIRNDFSEPSLFSGSENSEVREIQRSEISDPQKNIGSDKNIDIDNKINISIRENKEKIVRSQNATDEPLCLFANSRFSAFEDFAKHFNNDDYAGVDIRHYYEAVKNWSASKRVKRNDWIATARGFMHRDFQRGELVRIKPQGGDVLSEGAKRYLQMGLNLDGDELWPGL